MFPPAVLVLPPLTRWIYTLLQRQPDLTVADLADLTGSDASQVMRAQAALAALEDRDARGPVQGVRAGRIVRLARLLSREGGTVEVYRKVGAAQYVIGDRAEAGALFGEAELLGVAEGGQWRAARVHAARRPARVEALALAGDTGGEVGVYLSPEGAVRYRVSEAPLPGWILVSVAHSSGTRLVRQGAPNAIRAREREGR